MRSDLDDGCRAPTVIRDRRRGPPGTPSSLPCLQTMDLGAKSAAGLRRSNARPNRKCLRGRRPLGRESGRPSSGSKRPGLGPHCGDAALGGRPNHLLGCGLRPSAWGNAAGSCQSWGLARFGIGEREELGQVGPPSVLEMSEVQDSNLYQVTVMPPYMCGQGVDSRLRGNDDFTVRSNRIGISMRVLTPHVL